jgi:hypothetical protein
MLLIIVLFILVVLIGIKMIYSMPGSFSSTVRMVLSGIIIFVILLFLFWLGMMVFEVGPYMREM